MNILGVIAEFNPLHTGHAYLLDTLRRETRADFCIVVMSGDYVQRGEPAFFTKELRTKAALLCGADLVLELPLSVSTGSAEYFAQGAVSLLDKLGCVTHLGFGSESGNIRAFTLAGRLLCRESKEYRVTLQQNLKNGMNFPKARYEALSAFLKEASPTGNASADSPDKTPRALSEEHPFFTKDDIPEILALLESPNNILGTEYSKALIRRRSFMIPVTIKRRGAGYHDTLIPSPENGSFSGENNGDSALSFSSASALRKCFAASFPSPEAEALLPEYIPAPCRALYQEALSDRLCLTPDDFYLPLFYALQYADKEALSTYQDVTPQLAERILKLRLSADSCTDFVEKLKTRDLTAARIRRSLLHILLQVTKTSVLQQKEADYCLYARILGFRRDAAPLLSQIKKQASIPLVSKLADAHTVLGSAALSQLKQTVSASELYGAVLSARAAQKGNRSVPVKSEYAKNIIISS